MPKQNFALQTQRLGPLPLVNHFLWRLGIDKLLEQHVPTHDQRVTLPYAKGLGVLLRSIIVEREPIYRQQETVEAFAPFMFGLSSLEVGHLSDDRVGRALDRLFDADRAALLTAVVVAAHRRFGLDFEELHNDSTTVRLCGQYARARGRRLRGRRAPWITYGHSKDHRPDLCAVAHGADHHQRRRCPRAIQRRRWQRQRCAHAHRHLGGLAPGHRARRLPVCRGLQALHARQHELHRPARRPLRHRAVPRTRLEDREFRAWIQTHEPPWELVFDRPHPRRKHGPRDRWWVWRASLPSREAWPVFWVYSEILALGQADTRRECLAAAGQELEELKARLAQPRARLKKPAEVERRIAQILEQHQVARYLKVQCTAHEEHEFRQTRPGRSGVQTHYRRITHRRHDIQWTLDEAAIAYDRKSDGMYPLLTNHRGLAPADVLKAHKRQPGIEKRFQQAKSVHLIAPVFLKNEGRIEALFTLYFLALLVQGLIERELRRAMAREGIADLPLYAESRECQHPTTEQVLRTFSLAQRHVLAQDGQIIQTFEVELTELQQQILGLLGVPRSAYAKLG